MNEDILKGKWKQIKGNVKRSWGRLTDDEMDVIEGDRDRLVGKLQEHYGYSRQEAERAVEDFLTDEGSDFDRPTRM
jgi:uncharacterized protein YjbJ (UPF0337 family)